MELLPHLSSVAHAGPARRIGVLAAQVCASITDRGPAFQETATALGKAEILALRQSHTCAAQSISYLNTNPLLIVRGEGAELFDEAGQRYLDTRNNVCHVGHAHPHVAAAISGQAAALNTNTRYLHPNLSLLAKRLASTFQPGCGLEVCFFVNSGSEANDLACRLAFARTRSRDIVVVDHGYHGHTMQTIDISPYKFEKEGCEGKKSNIHKVPCPDTYRGPHKGPNAGERYADYVEQACKAAPGGQVAAFFVESGMSVGGVILPPAGYLKGCYKAVRAAGGVCVADEVQVGFGRFGKHFWAFEQQDVVPDIVTMGKPFGNGLPLAAVVTTRSIAEAFAQGPEYFNTFGGNPVCCAAGNAVLDVLRDERLRENASDVGDYLSAGFRALAKTRPIIGDVRGCGLFIGVEFVRDLTNLTPAAAETSELCSRLKDEHKILTSIDGPHNNVIVIKPPMCFSRANADELLAAVDIVLGSLTATGESNGSHTPT